MKRPVHITKSSDLVTSYEEIRAGFLKLTLEKNRLATPYVQEAKALKTIASRVSTSGQLLDLPDIRPALLAAAGLSNKALNHITRDTEDAIIAELIEIFLEPAGKDFVDELVFRFLLTKGDALGGRMRNVGGQLAQQQFVSALVATLSIRNNTFQWLDRKTNTWINGKQKDADIRLRAKGIYWRVEETHRTLLLNITVPTLNKNVDLCLLNTPHTAVRAGRKMNSPQNDPKLYVALGELKGGIDPAGADEHWKTAISSLSRIRDFFGNNNPYLFLIAASVAKAMAEEIFNQLENGSLSFAANLTNEDQLFDLCDWLVSI